MSLINDLRIDLSKGRSAKIPHYTDELLQYVADHATSPHPSLDLVRSRAASDEMNFMLTSEDQASLLYLICKMLDARKILEIGCYLGHSTIALAASLPKDGRVVSLDHNSQWAAQAQKNFSDANMLEMIDLRIGEALDLLPLLKEEIKNNLFDLAFIDADKVNSLNYYKVIIDMVRPGGVILIDNVLWRGHIIDVSDQSVRAVALRELNEYIRGDKRVEKLILTISDGMFLIRKKN